METFTDYSIETFVVEKCYKCGVPFGIPLELQKTLRRDKTEFFCVHGHRQCYVGKSEEEKLRDIVATQETEIEGLEASRDGAFRREDIANKHASAHKGQVTKIKNRIKRGVCPCCNRTFVNLQKHMESQHKDYVESNHK